ncbi:1-acyl-sn-glycerol-3-phosphate acyltransferase [Actinomadura craniellae]|uniref:1-acyl-sn-glycerol-3-phosphate acyltransferase n=1 Tax=Actinomadura craniellae TaxID=2231787 RepID=A0A365H028_9ACTN|nr:lysophospholipid acyltransferase family protein [Actinomadura craniellae]RAY12439.1 1-acyl-sn-glycerol-3-phosphate acyltransferase [Actinomadura craniellae]
MSHGYSPRWRGFVIAVLRPLLVSLLKRDWRGRENVPRRGGVIVAANHLSWADPLALGHFVYASGRFPVYLAKSTLFTVPIVGAVLRGCGQIAVRRGQLDAGQALEPAREALRAGECLMFYPEGTCTRDPELWPMTGRTGAARLALASGAPVVPIAHWGAQDVLPYGSRRPRLLPRRTMRVVAGPPVDLSRYADVPVTAEVLRDATADIMRAIADLLGELRGEEPPKELYDPRKKAS